MVDLLSVCLFENADPNPNNYYSRMKLKKRFPNKGGTNIIKEMPKPNAKDHEFDSKSFKIDKELFIEKISFAQLAFTKIIAEPKIQ